MSELEWIEELYLKDRNTESINVPLLIILRWIVLTQYCPFRADEGNGLRKKISLMKTYL